MSFFVTNNRAYDYPPSGELCSFDSNGLTFNMRFGPSETLISDDRILSFEVGFLECGTVSLDRKLLLIQKHCLLLKDKELAPFVFENIQNSDQGGSRFSVKINLEEIEMSIALRHMRKALMIMTVNNILSQEKALPYYQYIGCLQSLCTDPLPPAEAGEKLVTGLFRARLEIPQVTG